MSLLRLPHPRTTSTVVRFSAIWRCICDWRDFATLRVFGKSPESNYYSQLGVEMQASRQAVASAATLRLRVHILPQSRGRPQTHTQRPLSSVCLQRCHKPSTFLPESHLPILFLSECVRRKSPTCNIGVLRFVTSIFVYSCKFYFTATYMFMIDIFN